MNALTWLSNANLICTIGIRLDEKRKLVMIDKVGLVKVQNRQQVLPVDNNSKHFVAGFEKHPCFAEHL